jgi:hypothetical protein
MGDQKSSRVFIAGELKILRTLYTHEKHIFWALKNIHVIHIKMNDISCIKLFPTYVAGHFGSLLLFSSPELKAQVSYSDRPLSVEKHKCIFKFEMHDMFSIRIVKV